jgi:hypothetical protein
MLQSITQPSFIPAASQVIQSFRKRAGFVEEEAPAAPTLSHNHPMLYKEYILEETRVFFAPSLVKFLQYC